MGQFSFGSDGGDFGFSPSFEFGFGSDSGPSFGVGGGFGGGFDFGSAGGAFDFGSGAGSGASSFSPGGGVDIFGTQFPDPTSEAYDMGAIGGGGGGDLFGGGAGQDTLGGDTFADRFGAATDAMRTGDFDPQGLNNFNPDQFGASTGTSLFDTGTAPIMFLDQDTGMSGAQAGAPGSAPFDFGSGNVPGFNAPVMGPPMTGEYGGLPLGGGSGREFGASAKSAAAPTEGSGSFLDKLGQGVVSGLAKNPLGILASGAGLAMNLFKGNEDPEGLAQLREAAKELKSTGSVMQTYLQTGKLPDGMQASVDAATRAARARIIGNHARRGLSTDPTKNSALAQELSQLEQNAIITAATLGDKLMSQGLSMTGMANQLYQAIMGLDMKRSEATGAAISNFAAALGGSGATARKAI